MTPYKQQPAPVPTYERKIIEDSFAFCKLSFTEFLLEYHKILSWYHTSAFQLSNHLQVFQSSHLDEWSYKIICIIKSLNY